MSASPRKISGRRQGSSDGTSSAYDALRFLRTTNKWGEPFQLATNLLFLNFKIKIFSHRYAHHDFPIIMIWKKLYKNFITK